MCVCLLLVSADKHGAAPPTLPFTAHSSYITVVTFSPNNKWLGTGDDAGNFFIWDLATKRISMSLRTRRCAVLASAFDPAGTKCAISYEDGMIAIAEVTTQHSLRRRMGEPVVGMFFSHDDELQLVDLRAVSSYSIAKRQRTHVTRDPQQTASRVAFSKDGTLLAIAANDDRLRVLDLRNKQIVSRLPASDSPIMGLAFDESQTKLACGLLNGEMRVWDWKLKKIIKKTRANARMGITCLAYNPKSGILVAGTLSGLLRIWDLTHVREVQVWPVRGVVSAVCFSNDGKLLCIGYGNLMRDDPLNGIVELLEAPAGVR